MDENDLFDDVEEETETQQDSGPMKQLRGHANKLEKTLKAKDTELEELRTFKAEYEKTQRTSSVQKVFTDLNLNAAAAKFWNLENPDSEPSAETVGKWAVENGFAQVTDEPADQGIGFTPTTTSEGFAPGTKTYEGDEARKLLKDDPAKAMKLLETGRLRLDKVDIGRDRPGEEAALAILRGES